MDHCSRTALAAARRTDLGRRIVVEAVAPNTRGLRRRMRRRRLGAGTVADRVVLGRGSAREGGRDSESEDKDCVLDCSLVRTLVVAVDILAAAGMFLQVGRSPVAGEAGCSLLLHRRRNSRCLP